MDDDRREFDAILLAVEWHEFLSDELRLECPAPAFDWMRPRDAVLAELPSTAAS